MTYLVVTDKDGFLSIDSKGYTMHSTLRNAITWSDDDQGKEMAKRFAKTHAADVFRVKCEFEELPV